MGTETDKLSFERLFMLSGVYALFYTFCLYRNGMGITFPVFTLGTAGLFLYYLRLTGRVVKRGTGLYVAGIVLLGLNVCLTSNEIVILFDKGFICMMIRPGTCPNTYCPCAVMPSLLCGFCRDR